MCGLILDHFGKSKLSFLKQQRWSETDPIAIGFGGLKRTVNKRLCMVCGSLGKPIRKLA